jgi:hypothetical protein
MGKLNAAKFEQGCKLNAAKILSKAAHYIDGYAG